MLRKSIHRWIAGALAVALTLAACAPADSTQTPGAIGTRPGNVDVTPQATEVLPTEPQATEGEPTAPMATAGPTEAAMTPGASPAATTPPTSEPEAEGQPTILLSTELVGSQVVDVRGDNVGNVLEVLMDDTGAVQYVIVDAAIYLAGLPVAATADPLASPDPDALNAGMVAAPLNAFEINTRTTADGEINADQVLIFQGTTTDLESMAGFDLSVFDQEGFIIDTEGTDLEASFDGLIRVSEFSDWALVNAADENLGEVEDLVVDLNEARVTFGVVDFGGFLGIGEQSTVVPWDVFVIEPAAGADARFVLDVTPETLEDAPLIDLGAWPAWPERVETNTEWNLNWQNDAANFWEAAASS